jgi:hypothetical protein
MTPCEKYDESHLIDYVTDELDARRVGAIETHLQTCPACAQEVGELRAVLQLTDEAEAARLIPTWELEDIEMKVYKRLASDLRPPTTVRPSKLPFFSRFLHRFSNDLSPRRVGKPAWVWRGAFASGALAVTLLAATLFWDGTETPNAPLTAIVVQSPSERINQYFQQELRRDLEEALVTQNLSNDDWQATANFRRLAERAPGTPPATYAAQQLRMAHTGK